MSAPNSQTAKDLYDAAHAAMTFLADMQPNAGTQASKLMHRLDRVIRAYESSGPTDGDTPRTDAIGHKCLPSSVCVSKMPQESYDAVMAILREWSALAKQLELELNAARAPQPEAGPGSGE